jgi:hypothetical protein
MRRGEGMNALYFYRAITLPDGSIGTHKSQIVISQSKRRGDTTPNRRQAIAFAHGNGYFRTAKEALAMGKGGRLRKLTDAVLGAYQ